MRLPGFGYYSQAVERMVAEILAEGEQIVEYGLPIITQRLCLRKPIQSDIASLASIFADDRVTRWLAVDHLSDEQAIEFATEFVSDSHQELADVGCGPLVVTRRKDRDDDVIGYCGLRPLPGDERSLELVYAVHYAHRRNGIVSEAAQACIEWGFERFLIDRIVAFARAGNSASLAVMAGLKMSFKGYTERYYGERLVQFIIESPRFVAASADFRPQ